MNENRNQMNKKKELIANNFKKIVDFKRERNEMDKESCSGKFQRRKKGCTNIQT